ncbi:MAG: (2Fe-2S)-binding protein, partial [Alkalispirochaetaceae bacterium]
MERVKVRINGTEREAAAGGSLLDYLRDELSLPGTKNGCGTGECGSCTVIINERARRACTVDLSTLDGAEVTTIEALAPASGTDTDGVALHPIQEAFLRHGAVQCGFCTPGMILSVKALLDRNPEPTEEQTRSALQGNLCRCTGYQQILRAVADLAGSPGARGEDAGSGEGARGEGAGLGEA